MSRPRAATPPRRIRVLVLALAIGGCGSSAKSEEGALEPVRVSVSRHFTNAPLLLAKEAGFFEEEGLALEILDTFGNTSQLVPALSQGRIDVLASAVSIGLLNAIGREGAIRLVADKGHYAPEACSSVAIVARRGLVPPGTPVGPELFRGRRFAMGDVASGSRYFFEAMLDSLGLQEGDVETRDVPSMGALEALNSGAVDFVRALEPMLTHLQAAGHRVVLGGETVLPNSQIGIVTFGPTLLAGNRDAGRRFIRAYLRGVREYNQGKTDRNLALLARATRLDPATLERLCWPAIRADGHINAQSLMDQQEWAVRKGFLDRAFPAESLWDRSFVDSAATELARTR